MKNLQGKFRELTYQELLKMNGGYGGSSGGSSRGYSGTSGGGNSCSSGGKAAEVKPIQQLAETEVTQLPQVA